MRRLEICSDLEIERIIPRFCPFCDSKLSKGNINSFKVSCYYKLQKETDSLSIIKRLFYEKKIRLLVCETYKIIISFCTCGDYEITIRDEKKLNNVPFLDKGFEFKL